jgi:hypothetical protein
MAKIVEDVLIIKFSSIVRDNAAKDSQLVTDEIIGALEQVAQELAGNGVVVEVEKA